MKKQNDVSPLVAQNDAPQVNTGPDTAPENDFGFTFSVIEDRVEEEEDTSKDEIIKTLKKMIMPLLENLVKSADKGDTIFWPKRKSEIEPLIKKIEDLTKDIQ